MDRGREVKTLAFVRSLYSLWFAVCVPEIHLSEGDLLPCFPAPAGSPARLENIVYIIIIAVQLSAALSLPRA